MRDHLTYIFSSPALSVCIVKSVIQGRLRHTVNFKSFKRLSWNQWQYSWCIIFSRCINTCRIRIVACQLLWDTSYFSFYLCKIPCKCMQNMHLQNMHNILMNLSNSSYRTITDIIKKFNLKPNQSSWLIWKTQQIWGAMWVLPEQSSFLKS